MDYKDWLKRKDLEYQDGILHFDGATTLDLVKEYGTPIYVINENIIRKRYKKLKEMLDSEYSNNEIHFAVKSNSNLSVLKILNSENAGFDCTSIGEIFLCMEAGIDPSKIIYTGNMFTNEDFDYAIERDILINLDSVSQLYRLAKAYEKAEKEKGVISFRINPEFGAGHHAHTITAGKEIKFGILDNQVVDAYSKAMELGFKKFGIHIHIGSGIIDPHDYEKGVERYISIIKKLASELEIIFEFVDFGGGLGIPYRPEEDPLDLDLYKEIVVVQFKKLVDEGYIGTPNLFIEPGRFISGEASIILSEINTIKYNGYKYFAGLNAGFNTLIRPTMYGSYHHIIPCKKNEKGEKITYDIAGPICESGDILGKEREFNELKEGDYLAILDAGAYGFTMSSPYNSRPRAAEILLKNGESFLVREKEIFGDFVKNQKIPAHLK